MVTVDRVALAYREGTSDKVYNMELLQSGPKTWVVRTAYGRRGARMTENEWTGGEEQARALFSKTLREKAGKGYQVVESRKPTTPTTATRSGAPTAPMGLPGTVFTRTTTPPTRQVTGIFCQLLNPIEPDEAARYLQDSAWWAQPKYDGKRIVLKVAGGKATAINRKAQACPLPQVVADEAVRLAGAYAEIGQSFIIDGELVGERLWLFDLFELCGVDCRMKPYDKRLELLELLLSTPGSFPSLRPVETAKTTADKIALTERLTHEEAEGLVLKKWSAPWRAGRPTRYGDQLKVKFWASASVLAAGPNGTKHSVAIALLGGSGEPIPVGHVGMGSLSIPDVGAVIEVKYLYAYPDTHHLAQPICLGLRDDIDPSDCTLGQLKYKAEVED